MQIQGGTLQYEVVKVHPHDPSAFTQGLVFHRGFLYEGTGLYGGSSLRKVDLTSGVVLEIKELSREFFGEGITILQGQVFQLTWRENKGFVYDLENFHKLKSFTYKSEGWGLTTDGEYLIMSDGSAYLTYLDPRTFQQVKRVLVLEESKPVSRLNELEFIQGKIYANVWLTSIIVVIDPDTGQVVDKLDLANLVEQEALNNPNSDVLNGIAYDPESDRLWVTGKLWSYIYEIRLID